ncbi:MAG TPA: ABC transporter ATP-binding protein [Gammaproteobacteria bacterium]|nr:ABC transporter ATP-binding protein [Gammaproteobacteria bacterium]
MTVLAIKNLSHTFSGLHAITDFHLQVQSGEIAGVIGPNGAGKTTLFNVLCGVYPIQHGEISLDGKTLNGLTTEQITRAGIARTFQNIRLFKKLSVLDNIRIAVGSCDYPLRSAMLRQSRFLQQEQTTLDMAYDLLARFGLTQYAQSYAENLPYGLQRRLEIARALAINPKVLLLDEPACGMNPQETVELSCLIKEIFQERALAILLIDHQMRFVMSLCQHITVLNFGKIIAEGDPEMIRKHPEVIQSYLGG